MIPDFFCAPGEPAQSKMEVYMNKRFCRFFCCLFLVIIPAVPIATILAPKEDFSAEENRMLAEMPALTGEAVWTGDYTEGLAAYVRDRIPLRETLLKIKSLAEYATLKKENNNVIAAKNGYLIKRFCYNEEQLKQFEKNLAAAERLCREAEAYGKPPVFVCAPRAMDVLGFLCPSFGEPYDVWAMAEEHGTLSLTGALREKAEEGQAIWFKTDHHWTTLGAYYAYAELGEALGYVPFPREAFEEQLVSDDFWGTTYSACLLPVTRPDKVVSMRFAGDEEFVCTDVSTGTVYRGFYRPEALESKDKYEYFLGRNVAHLRIAKDPARPRPSLVIVKDSYAQSLVPFLARHYDIELIDLRYFRTDAATTLRSLMDAPSFAGLLILCNVDSLTGPMGFERL